MTMPALVIGLGGTGQWVLTYLKQSLLETNQGSLPDTIRLLAYDTVLPPAIGGVREGFAAYGNVTLQPQQEYHYLGGDLYGFVRAIQQGKYPAISKWFDADYYLRSLPRASLIVSSGSGQSRALGRLALLRDLTHGEASVLRKTLRSVLSDLATQLHNTEPVRVFIVASLAGGTGSGMLIDLALLVRALCSSLAIPNTIAGFLTLPSAIGPSNDVILFQRSAAAWRELNRYMATNSGLHAVESTAHLDEQLGDMHEETSRILDVCYLVDGIVGDRPVSSSPELGIVPGIANAIEVMIDESSGSFYSAWLTTNLAPTFAERVDKPMFSAVGTFTYKVPFHYLQETFSHHLALATLERLLNPMRDDASQPHRITGLDPADPEVGFTTGREHAILLFERQQFYEGATESPTRFTERLARILQEGGKENLAHVQREASSGINRVGRSEGWLRDFVDFGDRHDMRDLAQRVNAVLGKHAVSSIPTSKALDESPEQGCMRLISAADEWTQQYLGTSASSEPGLTGQVGQILEECSRAQLAIFRRLLRLWVSSVLMGINETSSAQARSGKLGYAYDLLDALVAHLAECLEFMEAIAHYQDQVGLAEAIEQRLMQAEHYMRSQASRRRLFWNHPEAYESQKRFLAAVQSVADVHATEALYRVIFKTLRDMQKHCGDLREELHAWIQVLATGDPARGLSSVFTQIETALHSIDAAQSVERNIAVQRLLEPDSLTARDEDISKLLASLRWTVQENQSGLHLSLEITQGNRQDVILQQPVSVTPDDIVAASNGLLNLARLRFCDVPRTSGATDAIMQTFSNPHALVEELNSHSEPYFVGDLSARPLATSLMFCGQFDQQQGRAPKREYLDVVRRDLQIRRTGTVGIVPHDRIDFLTYSDPSKSVLITTLDMMLPQHFRAWHESILAYQNTRQGLPVFRQHIFPAEVNAAQYEARLLATRSGEYHLFHPKVVMLLNDIEILRQFILAWALRWIRLENVRGAFKLEFISPMDADQGVSLASARNVLPDPLDAIIGFGRAAASLFALHPDLAHMLAPKASEISAELLDQLQRERESSLSIQFLLGWIGKYRESLNTSKQTSDHVATAGAMIDPEAYSDLGQLVELLLEEFLGPSTRSSPLDFDTLRFLQAANWTVTERSSGYMVCSPPKGQSTAYGLPVCVRTFFGSARVDGPAIQRLYDVARLEFKGETRNRVIIAVTDQPPAASAFGHIYSYRAGDGLAIVVLPSSVMRRALTSSTSALELDRQLRRALGNVNLYEASMPITDFLTFFGRTSLIEDMLQIISRGEHIGIFGLRKIGKTSLMWQLKERIQKHGVAYIDLQGVPDEASLLYLRIIRELAQDVMQKYPGVRILDLELVKSRPLHGNERRERDLTAAELISAFERDLISIAEALHRQDSDARLVFFLDEVERTLPWEDSPGFVGWDQFWGLLRGIAQRWGFLSLVVASVDARINRTDRLKGVDNPLYKFLAHTVFLPPLAEQEDYDMIIGIGNQMGLQWEKSALEVVHRASGGHPFISREICGLAVSSEQKSSIITDDIVIGAVDAWLSNPECMVAQIWADRLSEAEQQLLIGLTQIQPASKADLIKHTADMQATALRQALTSLKERHIISVDRTQHKYAITFGVLSRWIEEDVLDPGDMPND